jgi:hypothetical protein
LTPSSLAPCLHCPAQLCHLFTAAAERRFCTCHHGCSHVAEASRCQPLLCHAPIPRATRQYHRIDQPTPPPSGLEHHRHCATVTAHKKEVFPFADRPSRSLVSI